MSKKSFLIFNKDKKRKPLTSFQQPIVKSKVFGQPIPENDSKFKFLFYILILIKYSLPDFVKDGIEHVRKYGMKTPGIFRTQPPEDELNMVLSKIEKGIYQFCDWGFLNNIF